MDDAVGHQKASIFDPEEPQPSVLRNYSRNAIDEALTAFDQ